MTEVEKREIQFNQMTVGRITNDLRKIHETSPENDEVVRDIAKVFGRHFDHHRMATEDYIPLSEIMLKKIFEEE